MPPKAQGSSVIEVRRRKPKIGPDGVAIPKSPAYRLKWRDPNVRDEAGKMIRQSLTFDDRTEAEKFAALLEAAGGVLAEAAAIAEAIRRKIPTVAEMIEEHVKLLTGVESRTRRDYRTMAALHILPHIGALPADTISRDRCREWVNDVYEAGPRHLGAALREFRADIAGMSRSQVAQALDKPLSFVVDYEKGEHRLSAAQFRAVCGVLGVPMRDWDKLARLGKPMSPKTLRNIHALLSHAFTTAIQERQLRPDNPAKGIALPKYHRPQNTYLTPLECSVLLSKFTHAAWRHAVQFMASTGVRWGELVALTVGDLHLNASIPYVSVNKAVKRGADGRGSYTGDPKSLSSNRLVSLPKSLVAMLRELTAGKPRDALLFTGPEGGRLHYSNFRERVWLPAVAAAYADRDDQGRMVPSEKRIPYKRVRIHDLRHSHASWMIMQHVDMFAVKNRLGHESITTTYNTYGHLDPRQLQAGADAMESILAEMIPPTPELDPFDPTADVIDLDAARRHAAEQRGEDVEPVDREQWVKVPAALAAAWRALLDRHDGNQVAALAAALGVDLADHDAVDGDELDAEEAG